MENIFHLAKSLYMLYMNEMVLVLLACIFILMILTLFAVRRCRRQIRNLTEKTKEFTKAAMSQNNLAAQREKARQRQMGEMQRNGQASVSKEDEELFGSVIQEIFP